MNRILDQFDHKRRERLMPLIKIEDHTFFRQLICNDTLVLDLGANHGAFSRTMIERFGCRCFAVEPNPRLAAAMSPHPKLTVLNVAVGAQNGLFPFHICDHDESSSLLKPTHHNVAECIPVRVVRIDQLAGELGLNQIGLLKLDIEGVEVEALEACPDEFLAAIPQITVEFHDFNGIISRDSAKRAAERLLRLGFDVVQVWMRSYGDTLFVNKRIARITHFDWLWSRYVQKNSWWVRRFVARKLGISR
jgi:FkbM family methyltransferase